MARRGRMESDVGESARACEQSRMGRRHPGRPLPDGVAISAGAAANRDRLETGQQRQHLHCLSLRIAMAGCRGVRARRGVKFMEETDARLKAVWNQGLI